MWVMLWKTAMQQWRDTCVFYLETETQKCTESSDSTLLCPVWTCIHQLFWRQTQNKTKGSSLKSLNRLLVYLHSIKAETVKWALPFFSPSGARQKAHCVRLTNSIIRKWQYCQSYFWFKQRDQFCEKNVTLELGSSNHAAVLSCSLTRFQLGVKNGQQFYVRNFTEKNHYTTETEVEQYCLL